MRKRKSSSQRSSNGGMVDPKAYEGTSVGVLAGDDPAGKPLDGARRASSTAALPPSPGGIRDTVNGPWRDDELDAKASGDALSERV